MGPKYNRMSPYKREAEGNEIQGKTEGSMTTGAETAVIGPQTQECWQPLEATRDKKRFSLKLQGEHGFANIVISAHETEFRLLTSRTMRLCISVF